MVVVLTVKEIRYLVVGTFNDLMGPFLICVFDIKFVGCAVYFNSAMA